MYLLFHSFSSFSSGVSCSDSMKSMILEEVMLTYLGDYVPDEVITEYSIFFNPILKQDNTELSAVDRIQVFPSGLNDANKELKLDYFVVNFQLKPKGNKVFNLICVLNEQLELLDFQKFLCKKRINKPEKRLAVADILPAKNSVFKVVYFEKNSSRNEPPVVLRSEYYGIKDAVIYIKN